MRNYQSFGVFPKGETTFAQLLKKAGYTTCIAGKWQLGKEKDLPQQLGFDEALLWQHITAGRKRVDGKKIDKRYENPVLEKNGEVIEYTNGEYGPDVIVDFICTFIEKNSDQPFLVYYPMILTHCPFVPTPDSADWNPKSIGSPTYKGDMKYFGDMVTYMDKLIGRIVDTVEKKGLGDSTIILFTGDNGTDEAVVSKLKGRQVAGAKGRTTDAGTRVPLIAAGAGVKAQVLDDLVDFSDFLPTLCDIAQADIPDTLEIDGRSFLPRLRGGKGMPREWIYCWYSREGEEGNARVFARTQEYKLYRNGQFFDVTNDPHEKQPLNNESLTARQIRIKDRLREVIEKYEGIRTD